MSLDRIHHKTEFSSLINKKLELKEEIEKLTKKHEESSSELTYVEEALREKTRALAKQGEDFIESELNPTQNLGRGFRDVRVTRFFKNEGYIAFKATALSNWLDRVDNEVVSLREELKVSKINHTLRNLGFGISLVINLLFLYQLLQ